jgi:hypothetical protein
VQQRLHDYYDGETLEDCLKRDKQIKRGAGLPNEYEDAVEVRRHRHLGQTKEVLTIQKL